ncbi:sporulation protein [Nonomuraea sp. NPDC048826]|uniref:sporulation protein n=1 Tax=Nonomuraea sp. NPDC048826 TaxID=3364347 RepID=UPI0037112C82
MAASGHPPNLALEKLIAESGASHKALAARVNQHCQAQGKAACYTHTSVANWISGMTPRWPTPRAIAAALSERLGRPVSVAEIGMPQPATTSLEIGLDFPRELPRAIDVAAAWWTLGDQVNRRAFGRLAFAAAAFSTPSTRWLIQPADADAALQPPQSRGRRVGAADLAELRDAAEHARHIDSKYGGGSFGSSLVAACLRERAVPLLKGCYTDAVGRELFSATAQLGRLAGYAAWDVGDQPGAQRHYIQALRLARAAGDVPLGGYILASMSLQAGLNDHVEDAIDMAQGAYERARDHATPRTLAFFKLVEARAHARAARRHGRACARRAAALALAHSETLLGQAHPDDGDPVWIDFFTHARLAADATEIHRDLQMPHMVMRFEEMATMPTLTYTRSAGMRNAIVGSAHLQARRLDEGLQHGHRAVDILSRVASTRSLTYVNDLLHALTPWEAETSVRQFRHRVRHELRIPA